MLTATLALTGGPIQDLSVYGWTDAMLVLLEASCNAELYLNFPRGAIKSCNFFVRLGWPHFNTHIRQLYKKKENIEKWNIEFGIFFVISHLHFVCKTFRRHSHHVRPTSSNKLGFLIWMLECRGVIMCAAAVRLCVFCVGCQEGELKARLCIVLQSVQSIWTTKRNETIVKAWCIKCLHCCVYSLPGIRIPTVFCTQLNKM